jgi:uncharacterized protein YecE (DUF72 family)
MHTLSIRVGCAGWSIPSQHAWLFPAEGSHLARYAAVFPAVEIDSSFYRLHREGTYRRWAATVPPDFRFAVKVPREITHRQRLAPGAPLEEFLQGPAALGDRLGPLLVQLPPKLAFDANVAGAFFTTLRARFDGDVVCEPRHASWFSAQADGMLKNLRIARVAADPAPVPEAAVPGGWRGLSYYRLHGSPERYRSAYSEDFLAQLVTRLRDDFAQGPVWCMFDNTAAGAAIGNALWVLTGLRLPPGRL